MGGPTTAGTCLSQGPCGGIGWQRGAEHHTAWQREQPAELTTHGPLKTTDFLPQQGSKIKMLVQALLHMGLSEHPRDAGKQGGVDEGIDASAQYECPN